MAFNLSKTIATAASTGLMLGALGCGSNSPTPETPAAGDPAAAAAGAKECCTGKNECSGKGGCAVEGAHDCAGKNECKGKGGCNAHCPK
jgi:hypothetical protein